MSATAALGQALRCLLIPCHRGQALLPQSSIIEVVPAATPLELEHVPAWVQGIIVFRSCKVPLISLDRLMFEAVVDFKAYSRIVVINALSPDPKLPYIGLLGTQSPRPIALSYGDIVPETTAAPRQQELLSWVQVKGQSAIIPDSVAIISILAPLMRLYL